jgi:hypothetical protein
MGGMQRVAYSRRDGTPLVYKRFEKIMRTNTVGLHYPEHCDRVLDLLVLDPQARLTAMDVAQRFPDQQQGPPSVDTRYASTGEGSSSKRQKLGT